MSKQGTLIGMMAIIFFCATKTSGQSVLIDSLERRLTERPIPDTVYVQILNLLAREYIYISAVKSTYYAQEALELSVKKNYTRGIGYAYRNLASGNSAQELFSVTTEYMEKAMAIFETLGDSVGIANCYISLGNTYRRQRDFSKAELYNQKAAGIFRKAMLTERLGVSLHNLGETQMLNGKPEAAIKSTDEAIGLLLSIKNLPVLTACYKVKGILYFDQSNFSKSREYFLKALAISDTLGENAQKEATAVAYVYLAKIAQKEDHPWVEISYLQKAIGLSRENKYRKLIEDSYLQLADFYIRKKDFAASRKTLHDFSLLNDSIQLLQSRDKAAMLAPMLNAVKMAAINNELQAQQHLQEKIIESQQTRIRTYLVTSLLLVVFLIFLFHFYRQRKKLTIALASQKKELEEKSIMLEEANATKDKFFSIVSHDLRSPLSSLHGMIILFTDYIDDIPKEEIKNLAKGLQEDVDNTLALTENLIAWATSQMEKSQPNITATEVKKKTIEVIDLYRETCRRKNISIHEDIPEHTLVFADSNQLTFIIRNLVNNALKFTPEGGVIYITAKELDSRTIIYIRDTGVGIPESKIRNLFLPGSARSSNGTAGEKGTGLGLVLIKEFLEKNNATIQVESTVGKGTEFRLSFQKGLVPVSEVITAMDLN